MDFFDIAKTYPTVCAAGDKYFVSVTVNRKCFMYITVGGKKYFNAVCGVNISETAAHLASVPSEILNEQKQYSVTLIPIVKRRSYSGKTLPEITKNFVFKPLEKGKEKINIIHIADTHNLTKKPIEYGKYFGENLDLLILNGDIGENAQTEKVYLNTYFISGEITKGAIPCIISRGNHDLRGPAAEALDKYFPLVDGKTYYNLKIGDLSFMVLDCGEDKDDSDKEYGNSVSCREFRAEETKFIEKSVQNDIYKNSKMNIVLCHMPFTILNNEKKFAIEKDTYSKWVELTSRINPKLYLFAHIHLFFIVNPGDEMDSFGQSCPALSGSEINKKGGRFSLAALTLYPDRNKVEIKQVGDILDKSKYGLENTDYFVI